MASKTALWERGDVGRIVVHVSIGVLAIEAIWVVGILLGSSPDVLVTLDFRIYRDAAERWINGDGFYQSGQLGGQYEVRIGDVLYPPVILWLLVPFLVLPPALWWAIPICMIAFAIWKANLAPWGWALILALCIWPRLPQIVIHGNPTMWVLAFASIAVLYGWSGPFVLVKPILAPFALIGAHRQAWWVGLVTFALLCVPFGGMWIEWAQVILDANGATYAFGDYQAMLLPLVVWVAQTRADDGEGATVLGRSQSIRQRRQTRSTSLEPRDDRATPD